MAPKSHRSTNESTVSGRMTTNESRAVCLVGEQVSGGVLTLNLRLEVGKQLLSVAVSSLLAGGSALHSSAMEGLVNKIKSPV